MKTLIVSYLKHMIINHKPKIQKNNPYIATTMLSGLWEIIIPNINTIQATINKRLCFFRLCKFIFISHKFDFQLYMSKLVLRNFYLFQRKYYEYINTKLVIQQLICVKLLINHKYYREYLDK